MAAAVAQEGFHAHEGWYFQRLEDGSVEISADVDIDGAPLSTHTIPASEWASIVAAVSWAGYTSDRHERALRFHGEETGYADG